MHIVLYAYCMSKDEIEYRYETKEFEGYLRRARFYVEMGKESFTVDVYTDNTNQDDTYQRILHKVRHSVDRFKLEDWVTAEWDELSGKAMDELIAMIGDEKIEKDEEFFSYFPEDNDFATHDTLEEAKESAQASLEWYQEDACDDGWNESVSQVCYGKVIASPIPTESYIRADYTDEEWDNKFPNNSNHDNVVVYSFDK